MDIQAYQQFAVETARAAGAILMEYRQKKFAISFKGGNPRNLVTEVDKLSEKFIVDAIKKQYPDHCVLSEEGGDCGLQPSDFCWIIDPIDGTTNYAHSYNFFAVSIALAYKGELLAGAIYAPMLNEMFHAGKGLGAYLNDERLHISKTSDMDGALLSTGFNANEAGRNMHIFGHIIPLVQGIRRAGSAALDMAYTAAGRLDGYWEYAIYPWDIAAGALLVTEAGGKVTDLYGNPLNLLENHAITTLTTNKHLHPQLLAHIEEAERRFQIAR